MEHIGEILGNLPREEPTPTPALLGNDVADNSLTQVEKEQQFMENASLSTLSHTFDSFKTLEGTQKALVAAKALGDGTTDKPFLLIYGGVGNGKTHLIEATIIALGKRGIWARYWTAAGLFDFLKSGIGVNSGTPDVAERTNQLCFAKTLIIDDLGVEYGTTWEWSRLEIIIDYRYRFRNITVVATNLDIIGKTEDDKYIPGLRDKSERIYSRFADGDVSQLVLNSGDDYRRQKART